MSDLFASRCRSWALLTALFLVILGCPAEAHQECNVMPTRIGRGVSVGATGAVEVGMGAEAGSVSQPHILVSVSYQGVDRQTGVAGTINRYFWVSGSVSLGTVGAVSGSGEHRQELGGVVNLSIVPASRLHFGADGTIRGVRYFPTQIGRDLNSGITSQITVHALGWSYFTQRPFGGRLQAPGDGSEPSDGTTEPGEPQDSAQKRARFLRFAHVAVDVLGLRFMSFVASQNGNMLGAQAASIMGQAGLGWDPSQSVQVRISAGGALGVGGGVGLGTGAPMAILEGEFFGRLQVNFNRAIVQFSLFMDAGVHAYQTFFHSPTPSSVPTSGVETGPHDHGLLLHTQGSSIPELPGDHESHSSSQPGHGHGFVRIGFTVSF